MPDRPTKPAIKPADLRIYYVFIASPGDVNPERQKVRDFFHNYNISTANPRGLEFQAIDWENYAAAGVANPQELITAPTLERFRDKLALVVGILAQRFAAPDARNESGSLIEFKWSLASHLKFGSPEIMWFFRDSDFRPPSDSEKVKSALNQWEKVCAFKDEIRSPGPRQLHYVDYKSVPDFAAQLSSHLTRWLNHPERPWAARRTPTRPPAP